MNLVVDVWPCEWQYTRSDGSWIGVELINERGRADLWQPCQVRLCSIREAAQITARAFPAARA